MNEGILLLDKPIHKTSFSLVHVLRKVTGVKKIGHAGTLDPLATGVMVMLVGRNYTKLSDTFLTHDKEYEATILLGKTSDTYDSMGEILTTSDLIPEAEQIESALESFQGKILQTPPMFSAKKLKGKKLYQYARDGIEVNREPVELTVKTTLLRYEHPQVDLRIACSKGTYIRSIAHDLGVMLGCGGIITKLTRIRSGPFELADCLTMENIDSYQDHLQTVPSQRSF